MPILATVGLFDVASRWIAVPVAALAVAFLVYPTAGRADTSVLPSNLGLPSSDPAHQSPLERLLAPIASHITGRPITVRCEGDHDWNVLAAQKNFDPKAEAGYVDTSTYLETNTFVNSATTMELSPSVCSHLQRFAQASAKPTKCQASTNRSAPCFLGTPTTSNGVCWTVPTLSGTRKNSCYGVTATRSASYWGEYSAYASALATLAHEATHLWQVQAGTRVPADALVESQATCSSMQWLPYVATQLGDTPGDAQAVADFYWKIRYPLYMSLTAAYSQSRPYWSADCKAGGALDIRDNKSGLWP
jgi:hypothetical protein